MSISCKYNKYPKLLPCLPVSLLSGAVPCYSHDQVSGLADFWGQICLSVDMDWDLGHLVSIYNRCWVMEQAKKCRAPAYSILGLHGWSYFPQTRSSSPRYNILVNVRAKNLPNHVISGLSLGQQPIGTLSIQDACNSSYAGGSPHQVKQPKAYP